MALTSTPTTSDNCLIHNTWNTSAAAPDINSSAAGRAVVNVRAPLSARCVSKPSIAAVPIRMPLFL
jgi:hypothetical protein